jgi:hypothetical protein
VGADEVARRPREIRRDRSDEEIVWSRGELVHGAGFGKLEQMAADTCPEAATSFWGHEETIARGDAVWLTQSP